MLSKEAQARINGIVEELIEGKRNVEFVNEGWAIPYYTPTLTIDESEFKELGVTTTGIATAIITKAIEIVLVDNIGSLSQWFFNAFDGKKLAHASEIARFEMPLSDIVKPVQRKHMTEEEALAKAEKTGFAQELRRYIVGCDECGCDIVIERINPDGSKFKSTWHTWH